MRPAKLLVYFLIILIAASFAPKPGPFVLGFAMSYDREPLTLNKKLYRDAAGDSLYLDAFKFYVSNVSFKTSKGWQRIKNSYYLVSAEEPSSLIRKINTQLPSPPDSIRFTIGVDSLTCVSGVMSGDLDPVKAMYWSWNTGYINAKLEGRSPSCKTIHQAFEFHIGGYLRPYNTLQTVSFKLKDKNKIMIAADAAQWLNGKERTDLHTLNSIVTTGREAVMMSNNYKEMFTPLP